MFDRKEYNKKYKKNNSEKVKQWSMNYRLKNKEKIKIKRREFYQKHCDLILFKNHKWAKNNPEIIKKNKKKYFLENKEKIRKHHREWRKEWLKNPKNREKLNEATGKWRLNNPEKFKKSNKKSHEKNKEKHKEMTKKWRKEHEGYIREYNQMNHKRYYEKNKEKVYQQVRKWCKKNPDVVKKYKRDYYKNGGKLIVKRWCLNHKERYRELGRRSELKRKNKNIIHAFAIDEWVAKKNATKGICPSCNTFVGTEKLTLDHIFPISKAEIGRVYTLDDVQPLCKICNCVKNSKIPEEMSHQITSPMR